MLLVDERKQFKIEVNPKAKRIVENFAEKFDMSEKGVASRLYEWFGTLPEPVQKWILRLTDGMEGDALKWFANSIKVGDWRPPVPSIPDVPDELDEKQSGEGQETGKGKRGGRSK